MASFLALNGVLLYVAGQSKTNVNSEGGILDDDERIAAQVSWPQSTGVCVIAGPRTATRFLADGIDDWGRTDGRVGSSSCAEILVLLATPIQGVGHFAFQHFLQRRSEQLS